MKGLSTKILLSSCIVLSVLVITPIKAQTTLPDPASFDVSEFLKAGSEDASTLMGQYLSPVFKGFGYGANGGWYNTAATHKTLGFDLSVSVMAAKAPDSEYFFDFVETDYLNTRLSSTNTAKQGSTVFGDPNGSLVLEAIVEDPEGNLPSVSTRFNAPPGIDYEDFGAESARGYVPFVMVQGGIGLFKNTDLKVRWVPTTKFDEAGFEMGMFGLGLMHDIKQWIPGIKHVPIDISAFVGYNRINATMEIPEGGIQGENQSAEFGINTWTYQLLVSKKLSFLTLYGGGGFNTASTKLEVNGTYEIEDNADNLLAPIVLTNPVNEKFKSDGWRGTLGLRMQLAIITLHADYTFQEYNMITAGIGVTVR